MITNKSQSHKGTVQQEHHIPPADERLWMPVIHFKIPQLELNLQPHSPEKNGELMKKRYKN